MRPESLLNVARENLRSIRSKLKILAPSLAAPRNSNEQAVQQRIKRISAYPTSLQEK